MRYFYVVVGKGSFPFKQLHFDCAWPASVEDAERIELACPTVAPEQRITLTSSERPNVGAWERAKWPIASIQR